MNKLTVVLTMGGLLLAATGTSYAKTCELNITGNDQLQYDKSELVVESDCDKVKLTLEHVGQMPVESMGHNWVLAPSEGWKEIAKAGTGAGAENDYLPKDAEGIIAHTDMIGGGESTSITFDVSDLEKGGDYTYFCSFPGHWGAMNGKLIVK